MNFWKFWGREHGSQSLQEMQMENNAEGCPDDQITIAQGKVLSEEMVNGKLANGTDGTEHHGIEGIF